MIPPAKLRQILELRRSTRVPPLLPPKKCSKRTDEAKRSGHPQHREILDIHVQLRNFGVSHQQQAMAGGGGSIACAFSESESDNQRGPWRMTTASELLSKGTASSSSSSNTVELPNVFAVEFQLENAAKFIRLDICDLHAMEANSVGYCVFSVSELVNAAGCKIQRKVMDDESGAEIADAFIACTVRAKPHAIVLQFVAKNLSKKHMANASLAHVFFEIHRLSSDDVVDEMDALSLCNGGGGPSNTATAAGATAAIPPDIGYCGTSNAVGSTDNHDGQSPKGSLLYRSESIKWHSSRVLWRAFTLQSTDILRRELRMLCFLRDTAKSPALPPVSLGEFPLFYSALRLGPGLENIYFLVYENSRHQKKNGGTFELCRLHEVCTPSFLEYIGAGSSLNLAFAIDFSRSGIFVDEQLVKHYIEDVELLIGAFGAALKDFSSSNSYPAFGFGAKIPPQFRESQEFCLNLNGTDPYCRGISGVLNAFKTSFTVVEPLNMAHLSHVIYYMAKLAQNSLCRMTSSSGVEMSGAEYRPPNYFVLVIITRGVFDDLKETVQSLIFASRAPLSIVFVGIGEDEQQLGELERLATAGTRLNFHGRKPERDCTQYVSLPLCRKEENKINDLKLAIVERGLSSVPAQMCNWMMRNGYQKVEPMPETAPIQQQAPTAPTSATTTTGVHTANSRELLVNAADFFGGNGVECRQSENSGRAPPHPLQGTRMRQSAQCLSMGRSSSSSSFGSNNKFLGGGVFSSAPGSALSISSSSPAAAASISNWPVNGRDAVMAKTNLFDGNGGGQPKFSSCSSRKWCVGGGAAVSTARPRRFAESRSLSSTANWWKMAAAAAGGKSIDELATVPNSSAG